MTSRFTEMHGESMLAGSHCFGRMSVRTQKIGVARTKGALEEKHPYYRKLQWDNPWKNRGGIINQSLGRKVQWIRFPQKVASVFLTIYVQIIEQ